MTTICLALGLILAGLGGSDVWVAQSVERPVEAGQVGGSIPSPDTIPAPLQAVKGVATWYDAPTSHDAAAGPLLRHMLGKHWRGQWVTVRSGAKSVTVHLTDWCLCSHGRRLIDLDNVAFSKLAPLGRGVIAVMIETVDASLPATDTAP